MEPWTFSHSDWGSGWDTLGLSSGLQGKRGFHPPVELGEKAKKSSRTWEKCALASPVLTSFKNKRVEGRKHGEDNKRKKDRK